MRTETFKIISNLLNLDDTLSNEKRQAIEAACNNNFVFCSQNEAAAALDVSSSWFIKWKKNQHDSDKTELCGPFPFTVYSHPVTGAKGYNLTEIINWKTSREAQNAQVS